MDIEIRDPAPRVSPAESRLQYASEPGFWDEALLRPGLPRRHWRRLALALADMGPEQFARRWEIGQQIIQNNGITYNVYGDPRGVRRPWEMDPIPLLMDPMEWRAIERAMVQRARLLNAVLADLYGPRRLLHERKIPAALVYSNPNFLRPCVGIRPPEGVFLHSYAADLARSPNGSWWVLSDRTQAPSGLGYALENRLVSARTLPGAFNQCRVRQLSRFFEIRAAALAALAPTQRLHPRIVLLTPGPSNETYFEHSYLAGHWGIPLVEGADLTVRDNRVFLKTLSGLDPVDLILRRMDDAFCDPVELRSDSLLGVPGLTQAVRSGNVAVVNALGSGLVETPALLAFLPGLARELLGEDLLMPSVATWWCGQEQPRDYVLRNLDHVVVKPLFKGSGRSALFPAAMSGEARERLARQIREDPEQYVAQEQVALSTTPVRTEQGLVPRHAVLRAFAAWDGVSYSVLPGGLTRVSTEARSLNVSMQRGGGSKDTWVLAEAGQPAVAHRAGEIQQRQLSPPAGLPSRVADNLFWLGRNMERVESALRLVRALLPALSGEEDYGRAATLDTALHILVELDFLAAEVRTSSLAQQRWEVQKTLLSMVYDPARASGIGANFKVVRGLAWQVKERLSEDTWRVLQELDREFSRTPPRSIGARLAAAMGMLNTTIITFSAFGGLLAESTTRGFGWRFLELGRRLERALQMALLLHAGLVRAPFDSAPILETLLRIADSTITYRSRYLTAMQPEFVLAMLVTDETVPRSLNFQVSSLLEHLSNLPPQEPHEERPLQLRLTEAALRSVRQASPDELAARDADGNLAGLQTLLRSLIQTLQEVSEAITARHFSHVSLSQLQPRP